MLDRSSLNSRNIEQLAIRAGVIERVNLDVIPDQRVKIGANELSLLFVH